MPLEAERDFCLALSTEANNLLQVLIRLRIRSIGTRALDHLGPLLQNGARFNLIHQNAFAFESVTYWTSHKSLYVLSYLPSQSRGLPRMVLGIAPPLRESFLTGRHPTFTVL
jgi:hypothetical protein